MKLLGTEYDVSLGSEETMTYEPVYNGELKQVFLKLVFLLVIILKSALGEQFALQFSLHCAHCWLDGKLIYLAEHSMSCSAHTLWYCLDSE